MIRRHCNKCTKEIQDGDRAAVRDGKVEARFSLPGGESGTIKVASSYYGGLEGNKKMRPDLCGECLIGFLRSK